MKEMVISFFPDGTAQHTLKDSFLKPKIGKRKIERMSDIVHNERLDKFCIRLRFPIPGLTYATTKVTTELLTEIGGPFGEYLDDAYFDNVSRVGSHPVTVIYFEKYEDAVALEIDLINRLRLRGLRV